MEPLEHEPALPAHVVTLQLLSLPASVAELYFPRRIQDLSCTGSFRRNYFVFGGTHMYMMSVGYLSEMSYYLTMCKKKIGRSYA